MNKRKWTEEELLDVLDLYANTEFGQIHSRNKHIVSLASKIERTPSAVALKMLNFASLDPRLEQKGMANASALDRKVWDQFFRETNEGGGAGN